MTERITNWVEFWGELVARQSSIPSRSGEPKESHRATNKRWAKPDSTQTFVIAQLNAAPGSTLLDIGAGKGSWAVRLAPHARQLTAIDSSPDMIQAMHELLSAQAVTNVDVVNGSWPDVQVEPHDFSFCSHGMYGAADLLTFIRRMEQVTRRTCFMVLRAPTPDGLMAQAALRIWGHPYDSPNFQVCYNVLLQMGIFANVLWADTGMWSPWRNASLEEALTEAKRRFGLAGPTEHDEFLMDLLHRHLSLEEGEYIWPRAVRSALIYWHPA